MNPSNHCSFTGRLTKTPELQHTTSGKSVTNFTLAVDDGYRSKDGEWVSSTDFVDFVAWDKLAEGICTSWKKGDLVTACGPLKNRTYTDKEGKKHTVSEIRVAGRKKLASPKNATPDVPSDYDYPPAPTDGDFTELDDDEELPL